MPDTIFFFLFGIENWKIIACIWAIIPIINILYFSLVPINKLNENGTGMGLRQLFKSSAFRILAIFMLPE